MTRYIDADALIVPLKEEYKKVKQAFDETSVFQAPDDVALNGALMQEVGAVIGMIEGAKAIDAVPVRHGKNVGTDYDEVDQFVCSGCGIEIQGWYKVEHDEDDGEETIHEYRFRYCPNCGARISE